MAPITDNRQLAPKQETLFRQILAHYETKNYKKAIKAADEILKKSPNHGQTISMKALVVFHQPANPEVNKTVADYEAEGVELAMLGVRKDHESQLCWHVLGMLSRAQKDYTKAFKSFMQGLKCDPNSQQILRDNAHIALHLRNYPVHLQNRVTLLQLRPNERKSWAALAMAYILDGQRDKAEDTLKKLAEISKGNPPSQIEDSELGMLRIQNLIVLERWPDAITLLNDLDQDGRINDQEKVIGYRARILYKLGRKEEAEDAFRALIDRNPDCIENYKGFLLNKGLDVDNITDETRPKILRALELMGELYPRATVPRRMSLNYATGNEFKSLISAYLAAGLERGVPSLFSDIKPLYTVSSQNREIVQSIVESYMRNLESSSTLTSSPSEDGTDSIQPSTTLLWTYYFLALHYAHPAGNSNPSPERSLEVLNKALEHTPTLPELWTAKARVLKYAGDAWGAAIAMEEARRMDGQDRFLNTKSGKYWLRAGEGKRAEEILGLFTKKDAPSPAADLVEMQCLWFLHEDAHSNLNSGNLGMALKRYHQIGKVYDDFEDDEFDFHGYCIRKSTFRAYLNAIEYGNDLRSQPTYVKAAISASKIYVNLADDPELAKKSAAPALDNGISAEEAKKAAQKAKKAAAKAGAAAKKATDKKGTPPAPTEPATPKDNDPQGALLLNTSQPLEAAYKLLKPLETARAASQSVDVWLAIYAVAIRRNKYLQASRALNKAFAFDPQHPELLAEIVHFQQKTSSLTDLPAATQVILQSTLSALAPSISDASSVQAFAQSIGTNHATSGPHVFASAKALYVASPSLLQNEVEPAVFKLLDTSVTASPSTVLSGWEFLRSIQSSRAEEFRVQASKQWPLARGLDTEQERLSIRAQWEKDEERRAEEEKNGDL